MKALASTLETVGVRQRPQKAATKERLVELRPGMVSFATVDRLSERLGIPTSELLATIGVSGRTAARRRHEGTLKLDEADRLLRVARVVEEADRVFGSGDKANRWLRTAHPMLNDSCPLALLDSDAGAQSVSDELTRIEFGDFA